MHSHTLTNNLLKNNFNKNKLILSFNKLKTQYLGENNMPTYTIKENEYGVLYKNNTFSKILTSGTHSFFNPLINLKVDVFSRESHFDAQILPYLESKHANILSQHMDHFKTTDHEIGLRFVESDLIEIIAPNTSRYYWKGFRKTIVEYIDLKSDCVISPAHLEAVIKLLKSCDHKTKEFITAFTLIFNVPDNQIALASKAARLLSINETGTHGMWLNPNDPVSIQVEKYNLHAEYVNDMRFAFAQPHAELFNRYFNIFQTNQTQIGLRFLNQQLVEIIGPNQNCCFIKGHLNHTVEIVETQADDRLDEATIKHIQTAMKKGSITGLNWVQLIDIPKYHIALLYRNQSFCMALESGLIGFWLTKSNISTAIFDTRQQSVEVSGQEILTKDKVGLRVNLSATWQIHDAQTVAATVADIQALLYKELQFGLRAAVGTRTLDELLENKNVIDSTVSSYIAEKMANSGINVLSIGVKDIILPGEIKAILTQVVQAEKSAQANVIRRREETQASRSLLNTAKVMEDNPVALRLKELETLEKITERIDHLTVHGGLEHLLNGLVTLNPNK